VKKLHHNDWAHAAVRVAESIPLRALHPEALAWTQGRTRAARCPWAIALSGGADSLALLLLIWAHWPERRGDLVALHFDHRLRGAESRADAVFCRKLCRSLGVHFEMGVWRRLPSAAISEAAARSARMAFFTETTARAGCKALFLGHQMDDVAETLLMRLARGSGPAGLTAPRPVQIMPDGTLRLRPLLTVKKADLCRVLKKAEIVWREDASNAGPLYFRNRVRNKVIPTWLRAAPERDGLVGAALTRELIQEDADALDSWLSSLKPLKRGPRLDLLVLEGKPKAIWRRALHLWIAASPYRGDLSRQGFESLLSAVMRGLATRQSLGREGFAVISKGLLRYERARLARVLK
jgi:tRNA(Ile)-lysidine synthase